MFTLAFFYLPRKKMVNTSDDFAVFVKDSLKEMLGPSKRVSVHTLKHDRMNSQLDGSKQM